MKKILILSYDVTIPFEYMESKSKNSIDVFKFYLKDYEVHSFKYNDFSIKDGIPYILNNKLSSYDFVFFGFMSKETTLSTIIFEYISNLGIPYMKYGNFRNKDNKGYGNFLLEKLNIPYIPSFLFCKKSKHNLEIIKNLNYPLVLKPIDGSKGDNVIKVDDFKSFKKIRIGGTSLLQPFIENDGDYRVFVINNKIELISKRKRKDESDFRNNVCLGGTISKEVLPDDILSKIELASNYIDCNIIGFDVIVDKNDNTKWYIMEYNSAPSFFLFSKETNIDLFKIICDNIKSKIQKKEETPHVTSSYSTPF